MKNNTKIRTMGQSSVLRFPTVVLLVISLILLIIVDHNEGKETRRRRPKLQLIQYYTDARHPKELKHAAAYLELKYPILSSPRTNTLISKDTAKRRKPPPHPPLKAFEELDDYGWNLDSDSHSPGRKLKPGKPKVNTYVKTIKYVKDGEDVEIRHEGEWEDPSVTEWETEGDNDNNYVVGGPPMYEMGGGSEGYSRDGPPPPSKKKKKSGRSRRPPPPGPSLEDEGYMPGPPPSSREQYGPPPSSQSSGEQQYGPPQPTPSFKEQYGPPEHAPSFKEQHGPPPQQSSVEQQYGPPTPPHQNYLAPPPQQEQPWYPPQGQDRSLDSPPPSQGLYGPPPQQPQGQSYGPPPPPQQQSPVQNLYDKPLPSYHVPPRNNGPPPPPRHRQPLRGPRPGPEALKSHSPPPPPPSSYLAPLIENLPLHHPYEAHPHLDTYISPSFKKPQKSNIPIQPDEKVLKNTYTQEYIWVRREEGSENIRLTLDPVRKSTYYIDDVPTKRRIHVVSRERVCIAGQPRENEKAAALPCQDGQEGAVVPDSPVIQWEFVPIKNGQYWVQLSGTNLCLQPGEGDSVPRFVEMKGCDLYEERQLWEVGTVQKDWKH